MYVYCCVKGELSTQSGHLQPLGFRQHGDDTINRGNTIVVFKLLSPFR